MTKKNIKIERYIEEIPLQRAVDLASQVLKRPEGMNNETWKQNLSRDFVSGKKFFTVREMKISQKLE